MLCSVTARA